VTVGIRIQLLAFEHCWSISTGSYLTTLLNSHDLAPSDYLLLTYPKNWLRSQRYSNSEELIESVKTWLSSQVADFFVTGIQKLIPRYKCPTSGRDYIEK
jgi:hypothetical protein